MFDEKELTQNPFSFSLKIQVTKRIDNSKYSLDKDGVMLPVSSLMERQQTTKIYHGKPLMDIIMQLNDRDLRLFTYIVYMLEQNKDYIRIVPETYLKRTGTKDKRTYKAAINSLIRYNIIAATGFDNVYWINPNILFSGNRIAKYPDNIEIKGEYSI